MPDSNSSTSDPIKSRWVVQISGYDPRGASFYHKFFAQEADKYAEREGVKVSVGKRRRWNKYWSEWTATCEGDEYADQVRFLYLGWDDLIRRYWHRSKLALFKHAVAAHLNFFVTGAIGRIYQLSKYSAGLFFYPSVAFLVTHLVLATAGVFLVLGSALALGSSISSVWWILLGLLLGFIVAHQLTRFLRGTWVLQIISFTSLLAKRPLKSLEDRMKCQADDLLGELIQGEPDELLVCAHSVGASTVMIFLDKLLSDSRWGGRVRLLTLGECIPPTCTFQSEQGYFNKAMYRVATNPRVEWIDLTMPSDGACFGLTDPLQHVCKGPVPYPHDDLPKFLSARFMEGYSKKRFREIKRNGYMYHFRYLMTPDRPADCDYVAIVLGGQSLVDRFSHRPNQGRNSVV